MALTYEARRHLRNALSEHRRARLTADSELAEIELRAISGSPLSVEEEAALLLRGGASCREVGEKFGFSPDTASRIGMRYLGRRGTGRKPSISPDVRVEALRLVSQGLSRSEAARRCGVSVSLVGRWATAAAAA